MTFHLLHMLLIGMRGARIELLSFRLKDRDAVLTAASDDDAQAIGKALGIELKVTSSGGASWLTGVAEVEGVGVVISGPMRARLEAVP